jgi:hypothetical protein
VAVGDVAPAGVPALLGTWGLGEAQSEACAVAVTAEEAQVIPLPAMVRWGWYRVRATATAVMPATAVRTPPAMTHVLGIMPDHLPLGTPRERGGQDHLDTRT